MSAGLFTKGKYTTNAGVVVAIRVQPETLSATLGGTANASASGAVTPGYPRATVSKSKRSVGIHARTVTLRFVGAAAPAGYASNQTYTIPVMSAALWDTLAEETACTYQATPATVVSTSPEKIR